MLVRRPWGARCCLLFRPWPPPPAALFSSPADLSSTSRQPSEQPAECRHRRACGLLACDHPAMPANPEPAPRPARRTVLRAALAGGAGGGRPGHQRLPAPGRRPAEGSVHDAVRPGRFRRFGGSGGAADQTQRGRGGLRPGPPAGRAPGPGLRRCRRRAPRPRGAAGAARGRPLGARPRPRRPDARRGRRDRRRPAPPPRPRAPVRPVRPVPPARSPR